MEVPVGAKILVLREQWLHSIINGEKTMDIRGARMAAGIYFIGCKQWIYARAYFGDAQRIASLTEWNALRSEHRVNGGLPYKRTYGFRIRDLQVMKPVPFRHPRGAIGTVRYSG